MNNPKTSQLILTLYKHFLEEPELTDEHADLFCELAKQSCIQNTLAEAKKSNVDSWMYKVIQVVPMKDHNNIYIVDFDPNLMVIKIRKSINLGFVESLGVTINATTVFAPGFDFPVGYLNQFIFLNSEHYDGIINIRHEE